MQNKINKLVVLVTIFSLSSLHAGNSTGAKIGVINSETIMKDTALIKPYQDEIAQVQAQQEAHIKALDLELEKKYKALQAKAKVSDMSVLEKEQDALKDAKDKRDLEAKSASEKIQRAANKVMEQFGKLVQEAAQKVLVESGLDLIIDKNATLAYSKAVDVTDKLIVAIKELQASKNKPAANKEAVKAGK